MPLMTNETQQNLQAAFPNLFNHFISNNVSNATQDYNCIAWAYGIDTDRFWPNLYGYKWPQGITNEATVQSFIELFESIGYQQCNDSSFENGFLKVAIFTINEQPKHAARQLPDANWTSKLGFEEDITHSIEGMNNGYYGDATVFMRKAI